MPPCTALPLSSPTMTEGQRQCLLHILKNDAAALESIIALLERTDSSPTPHELAGCVRGAAKSLVKMHMRLKAGSFCCLKEEQCEFVGRFVGCRVGKGGMEL